MEFLESLSLSLSGLNIWKIFVLIHVKRTDEMLFVSHFIIFVQK